MTKYINHNNLLTIEPVGPAQEKAFKAYENDKNLFLTGAAGTGKTFILLHLAFKSVFNKETPYEKVVLIRSLLPSRDAGFHTGSLEEKSVLYQAPYRMLVRYLFEMPNKEEFNQLWSMLVDQESVDFQTTSFLRGQTFDNAIIIVDEAQNMIFQELDTVISRGGQNSKIMFSGDTAQTAFTQNSDRDGYLNFVGILSDMEEFSVIQFGIGDILRSGLVRSYLIEKEKFGIKQLDA